MFTLVVGAVGVDTDRLPNSTTELPVDTIGDQTTMPSKAAPCPAQRESSYRLFNGCQSLSPVHAQCIRIFFLVALKDSGLDRCCWIFCQPSSSNFDHQLRLFKSLAVALCNNVVVGDGNCFIGIGFVAPILALLAATCHRHTALPWQNGGWNGIQPAGRKNNAKEHTWKLRGIRGVCHDCNFPLLRPNTGLKAPAADIDCKTPLSLLTMFLRRVSCQVEAETKPKHVPVLLVN